MKESGSLKLCKPCGRSLGLDNFRLRSQTSRYRVSICISCERESNRKRNLTPKRRRQQQAYQASRYGLTPEDYDSLLATQGGKCAICQANEGHRLKNGTVARLTVDHCHNTGKVRGLLCNGCNRALGYLKDDAQLAQKAAVYLGFSVG